MDDVERPIECSECKKKTSTLYTEVLGQAITHTAMCDSCPALARRMGAGETKKERDDAATKMPLCCGTCGTTLDAMRMGHPLGCQECYEVFSDVLVTELAGAKRIPKHLNAKTSAIPLHIGRSHKDSCKVNPSIRLLALNEALAEMLNREDYEQAAWIRDQIKQLTTDPINPSQSGENN